MKKVVWIILALALIINVAAIICILLQPIERSFASRNLESSLSTDSLVNLEYLNLTDQQKKGRMFMVSIEGTTLTDSDIKFLKDNRVSGVILMLGNIENETQVKQLTSDLKEKVDKRLIIAIDQEGGDVVRIDWDKYAKTSARTLGNGGTAEDTQNIAKYRAQLLKDLGINMILGPVADVADSNSFMYSRSYSDDPEVVAAHVAAGIKAYHEAGLLTAVKHFPGHGDTQTDSHEGFPYINKTKAQLNEREFVPFKKAIENKTEFVMIGHIINSKISDQPASISPEYKTILEDEMGFEGVIITDDLKMTGEIDGGINWGLNLTIGDQNATLNRLSSISPEEKYVKKILELRYEKL